MADEQPPERDGIVRSAKSLGRSPIIFVSDASAEAERIADTLRTAGYVVADVPITMLSSRVGAQRPDVVLLDVDAEGSLGELARVRSIAGAAGIDFVYIGVGDGIVRNADDALAHDGSAFFLRPVDIGGLVRRIEGLTGGPLKREIRPSTPPPSLPSSRNSAPPSSERPSAPPSPPSLPSPGLRVPGPPLPMSTTSLADLADPHQSVASFGVVSDELRQLLADAEQRAEMSVADVSLPSPEDEIEAVLPLEVLESLDDPIDGDDEDEGLPDAGMRPGSIAPFADRAHGDRESEGRGTIAGTSQKPTTGGSARGFTAEANERRGSSAPPRSGSSASTTTGRRRTLAGVPGEATPGERVLTSPADAERFFAEAITRRATGSLRFESEGILRRILLRDGDLVAAASEAPSESLVSFLVLRGELPREEAPRLASKTPAYGRHGGAALVAHGWLRQDELWPALRAHAEWIGMAILRIARGVALLEHDPPARLRGEPSVFGSSTGPSIFVELIRRAVTPEESMQHVGGERSRLGDGPNRHLIAECNLPPAEQELLHRAMGGTIGELLSRAPDDEILSVVHALSLLGVVEIAPSPDFSKAQSGRSEAAAASLDEEAVRARVRARIALVEEGDYFAVLGVARNATGYEIRRAYLELRREFEPSRILSPRALDLADDVRKIVEVLEEAYDILRDGARRERYRRAIDEQP